MSTRSDVTPVDYDVDLGGGTDPPDDGSEDESDAAVAAQVAAALADDDSYSVCSGCVVPTCFEMVVSDASSSVDVVQLQNKLIEAFKMANSMSASDAISANASVSDLPG